MTYSALIVDKNNAARMRLKQALATINQYRELEFAGSLIEALKRLNDAEVWGIVFIAQGFDTYAIAQFILQAKNSRGGEDSAFVLLLNVEEQETGSIALKVIAGADGLLTLPYSVDKLIEITVLADRIKKERQQVRLEKAVRFLLRDILDQFDLVAYARSVGVPLNQGIRRLRRLCKTLQELDDTAIASYYDIALEMFEQAVPPTEYLQSFYSGASYRVKKMVIEKQIQEIQEEFNESDSQQKK